MASGSTIDWRGSDQCEIIQVDSSNRHIHLSAKDLTRLFGPDHALKIHAPLAGMPDDIAQASGFASTDVLNVVNPTNGRVIESVRILGPCRELTQIELAYTDCRMLGLNAPTRISGDTRFSSPCRLVNPMNGAQIDLAEGAIRAWRHIHMTPAQAERLGVSDRDLMALRVISPGNSAVLHDVMVRLFVFTNDMKDEMERRGLRQTLLVHLDTDEANAVMLQDATAFELLKHSVDGGYIAVVRNEGNLATNARRKNKAQWSSKEKQIRPGGVRPPDSRVPRRAVLTPKL